MGKGVLTLNGSNMKFKQALKMAKAILGAVKLTQEPLLDKSLIQYDGDDLEIGEVVYLCDGANDWSVLPDGLYQTMTNIKFVITDGVVSDINKDAYNPGPVQPNPLPQAIENSKMAKSDTDPFDLGGNEDNPGKNNGKAEGVYINGTPGKAQKELDEEMSEDAKDAGGKPAYGDVKYADPGYQTDKKKRYPIDTEEHIRAAWNYINKEKNANLYKEGTLSKVKEAIVAAWKDKIDKTGPPSAEKNSKMTFNTQAEVDAKKAEIARQIAELTKMSNEIVAAPAAGASPELKDSPTPGSVSADDYADLSKRHAELSAKHSVLRDEHDAHVQKFEDYCKASKDKFDEMSKDIKDLKKASDDHELALKEKDKEDKKTKEELKAAKATIDVLAKAPNGTPIEEVHSNQIVLDIDPKLKESMAYKILAGRKA